MTHTSTEIAGQDEQFLVQVGAIPVVQSVMDQVWMAYARTKETNSLTRFTLQTAELGVTMAMNTAMPIITKLPGKKMLYLPKYL